MIILSGPTGVGKSDVALALARYMPIEIINADVGQFYVPLTVGTAKPEWKNAPVVHHLFDIISEPKNITVVDFLSRVRVCADEICAHGNIPVLVGGSGFYLYSFFFPPVGTHACTSKKSYDKYSAIQLWKQLFLLDPERATRISKQDRYRIMRALDLWHAHGLKPSTLKPTFLPLLRPTFFFIINRERSDLYRRINVRVESMLDAGWIDEVASLSSSWHTFLLKKKLIGYDDIVHFLKDDDALRFDQLRLRIAQRTRAYAKRQLTFNRMITKKVEEQKESVYTEWVNVTADSDYEDVVQYLCNVVEKKGLKRVKP